MNDADKTREQLLRELTELRQQSEALRLSQDLIEHLPIGVTVYLQEDLDDPGSFRAIFRNSTAERITQVANELIIGKTLRESVPELLETEAPDIYAAAIRSGQTRELPNLRYGDDTVPEGVFAVKAVPLGGPLLALFFENITGRKQAEEALQEVHDQLEQRVEERTAELLAANRQLQSESTERKLRETQRLALLRVREKVWNMQNADDILQVLVAIRESLEALEIPFQECGINIVDTIDKPPMVHFHNMTREGKWIVSRGGEGKFMQHIMQAKGPLYRRDLEAEDLYQEREEFLPELSRSVRSVLDIPFAQGTLAVNSATPNAFSDQDVAILEEMAGVVAEGFQRMDDLRQLAAERERLATTLRSIGEGVISTDAEGRLLLLNKVAESLTGWTQKEAAGKPLPEIFHIVDAKTRQPGENSLNRVLQEGLASGLARQALLLARDGSERLVAGSGAPLQDSEDRTIGMVLVFRDITAQQKVEEELLKAEKLESIGVLAGGIAHDFNNLLTAIMGNVALAKMDADPDDKRSVYLTQAEKASLRAADLTRQLLTFSKGGAPIKKTASIKDLIQDSSTFALRGSNVRCEYSMPEEIWPADVDEGQISQVIQNLALNADQAMPAGGIIHIDVENEQLAADSGLPLQEGRYLKISIVDQGVGIQAAHLRQIFDSSIGQ